MTVSVTASLRVAALHHWPNAKPPVAYLAHPHRHQFHVTVWKSVTGLDRVVEIIQLKAEIGSFLLSIARETENGLDFGSMSCEAIAKAVVEGCGVDRCLVLEDGENGAEVVR